MGIFEAKKKTVPDFAYDPEKHRAVLRCSICNGEQVAGFRDRSSGHFTELMLIKDAGDLDAFMEMYQLSVVTKEY